jgi:hypothetical protein
MSHKQQHAFDPKAFVFDTSKTSVAVVTNGKGDNRCLACGSLWRDRERTRWWPISFRWAYFTFATWRVQCGFDRLGQTAWRRVFAIGWLRVVFGPDRHGPEMINLAMEGARERERADRFIEHLESETETELRHRRGECSCFKGGRPNFCAFAVPKVSLPVESSHTEGNE